MLSSPHFIHLRCHSEYSVVDGTVRIDDYVAAAVADKMPSIALTDLSNLFGAIKFYKAARGSGLKPLIGCDLWIENESNRDQPYRLLLLCQSHAGYLRLCQLITRAYLENQYRGRAEVKRQWFSEYEATAANSIKDDARASSTDGLIVLSSANAGDIGAALAQDNLPLAKKLAQRWSELFPNRFYIELQRSVSVQQPQQLKSQQERYIQKALNLAAELGLPVVATQPIQFTAPDDFKAHEARTCIAEGYVLADSRRPKNFSEEQYFKSQVQMQALFADIPVE